LSPKQKGIEQDKDLVKVDEMVKDASSWIRNNIASIFTSEYLFFHNFPDGDVYVDEHFKGTVGEDKRKKDMGNDPIQHDDSSSHRIQILSDSTYG
jgi:hypothetical protein